MNECLWNCALQEIVGIEKGHGNNEMGYGAEDETIKERFCVKRSEKAGKVMTSTEQNCVVKYVQ